MFWWGALGVGGTIAYMTDNESATNTFTVGKVMWI
ncbi:MAG: SipW-dependent-type signal peptide-containing protein [Enterocloster sp.]